jgi:predicted enzyme related to lactoylglutathione lyase
MAFLKDPTGAAFAIFQPGEHAGTDPQNTNLGWCELHTPDPAAARAFYTELFGWNAKADPSGHYTEFQVDGRSIGGMMQLQAPGTPPHWLLYALVDDCDASLAQALDMGARTLVPAQDVAGVGRFAVITDPAGAAIAIIKLTGRG